jgi:hypothetical protein
MTRKNEIVIHGMPPLTYDMSCCGITNLAKHRKRSEQFRRWDNKGVNCPHCLKSPTYRRLMAERAVRRITTTPMERIIEDSLSTSEGKLALAEYFSSATTYNPITKGGI